MSVKTTVVSLSAALVLAAFSGYFYLEMRKETQRADQAGIELADLGSRLSAAEADANRLRARLEEAQRREGILRARAGAAAAAAAAPAKEEEAAPQPAVEKAELALLPRPEPAVLAALEEADLLAADYLARGDIRGLWLLAADLLAHGEPGYEKIIALAKLLDKEWEARFLRPLWHEEELLAGSFLRSVADHHEEVLRFGLFLDRKDPRELPEFLRDMREELSHEIGPALIGYYRGDDPEILGGYVEFFRKRLSGDQQIPDRRKLDLIRGLGQIPTEEATDALIEALNSGSPELQSSAVGALAWQRNPRSIPILRNLLAITHEPRLRGKIEAAIRYLE